MQAALSVSAITSSGAQPGPVPWPDDAPLVTPGKAAASLSPADWSTATREDVLAAYEIFRRHHLGMVDPQDRGFPATLRRARDAALRFAMTVRDAEGHMRALALFSAALADGHAQVRAFYSGKGVTLWPGFRTVWRGNALYVVGSTDQSPPGGSELLACDGVNARAVIRRDVFRFDGRPAEAGQWWQYAPFLFQRVQSPYERLPARCRFRLPDGQSVTLPLDWRPMPNETLLAWMKATARREPVGLSEPRPGMLLITRSTFSPDEDGLVRYDHLFDDLDRSVARIASAKAVVLDLRNNRGGSWSWSRKVADRLWGAAAVRARLADYFKDTDIWWRADAETVQHFRQSARTLRAEGRNEDAHGFDLLADRLQASIAQGREIVVERYGASLRADRRRVASRPLPPVYVIHRRRMRKRVSGCSRPVHSICGSETGRRTDLCRHQSPGSAPSAFAVPARNGRVADQIMGEQAPAHWRGVSSGSSGERSGLVDANIARPYRA